MKEPSFTLKLSQLDKFLRNCDPFFRIIPLRVTMSFSKLSADKLRFLEEYADVREGQVERWLLVPSSMPLAVLGYTISRAFGIIPAGPVLSGFRLPPEVQERFAPTIGEALPLMGAVFDFIPDVEAEEELFQRALNSRNFVPPPPYNYEWLTYTTYQQEVRKYLLENDKEFLLDGKPADIRSLPFNDESCAAIAQYLELPVLSCQLLPFLPVPYVLQQPGLKLYSRDEAAHVLEKETMSPTGRGAKPFTYEIRFISCIDEDSFVFSVTRPKDVRELLADGYLELDDYIASCRYVACNCLPDCICKKGYDLFGPGEEIYAEFMLRLHSQDSAAVRQIASELGWREPYIDLKKVLR